VEWATSWSDDEIEENRAKDRDLKLRFFSSRRAVQPEGEETE